MTCEDADDDPLFKECLHEFENGSKVYLGKSGRITIVHESRVHSFTPEGWHNMADIAMMAQSFSNDVEAMTE